MKLTGNIHNIKAKREDKYQDITLHINKVEYITHKKDGKYFQPFNYVDSLATSLVISGDCLARTDTKYLEEGEQQFHVFDKVEGGYALNPDKQLSLTMEYDYDEQQFILTSVSYAVTITNEEFLRIQKERSKDKPAPKGKSRRNK